MPFHETPAMINKNATQDTPFMGELPSWLLFIWDDCRFIGFLTLHGIF